ncbi:hypothetical protein ACSSS7_005551 [Eimeria intestinalis]
MTPGDAMHTKRMRASLDETPIIPKFALRAYEQPVFFVAAAAAAAPTTIAAAAAAEEEAAAAAGAAMGANQSQPWKDGNTRLFWGVCAVMGAAAVFYCTRSSTSSSSSSSKTITDAELIQVLRAVTKEFHKIFAEAAQMASNLLSSLQLRGKNANPRTVRETVSESKIFGYCRLLSKEWYGALFFVTFVVGVQNPEVKQLVAGLKQMYEDALQGDLPLLPELSSAGASEEVTQKLQQTNTDAEASVLQEEQLLLQHEQQQQQQQQQQQIVLTPVVFLQAVALHCRDPEFKAKKAAIDQSHSERIFNLLKTGRNKMAAEPVSSWPELSLRLESCEGSDAYLLCLVAPRTNSSSSNSSSNSSSSSDVDAPLSLLSDFSAFLDDLEKSHPRLDCLATVCEAYAPIRAAVGRRGHCFALFKGKDLQEVSDEVEFFKDRIKEALGNSNSETSTNDSSGSSSSSSSSDSSSSSNNGAAASTPDRSIVEDAAAAAAAAAGDGPAGDSTATAAAAGNADEEEVEAVTAAETFPPTDPVAAAEAAETDDALVSDDAAKRAASPSTAAAAAGESDTA